MHILVYDPALFTTTPPVPTPMPIIPIEGGIQSNRYVLTCEGVPADGIEKTVVGRFNAK